MTQSLAGLVQHLAEAQFDQLQLGLPAVQYGSRQRSQQLVAFKMGSNYGREPPWRIPTTSL
jgi:hypothetical protein